LASSVELIGPCGRSWEIYDAINAAASVCAGEERLRHKRIFITNSSKRKHLLVFDLESVTLDGAPRLLESFFGVLCVYAARNQSGRALYVVSSSGSSPWVDTEMPIQPLILAEYHNQLSSPEYKQINVRGERCLR